MISSKQFIKPLQCILLYGYHTGILLNWYHTSIILYQYHTSIWIKIKSVFVVRTMQPTFWINTFFFNFLLKTLPLVQPIMCHTRHSIVSSPWKMFPSLKYICYMFSGLKCCVKWNLEFCHGILMIWYLYI